MTLPSTFPKIISQQVNNNEFYFLFHTIVVNNIHNENRVR